MFHRLQPVYLTLYAEALKSEYALSRIRKADAYSYPQHIAYLLSSAMPKIVSRCPLNTTSPLCTLPSHPLRTSRRFWAYRTSPCSKRSMSSALPYCSPFDFQSPCTLFGHLPGLFSIQSPFWTYSQHYGYPKWRRIEPINPLHYSISSVLNTFQKTLTFHSKKDSRMMWMKLLIFRRNVFKICSPQAYILFHP